ncbi:MAG: glycosyl hydrolase-related protein [Thermofilaceae archaeon]|nr:glycosyl hydrolase-related protein [Thermofilaceae archaeon]
MKPLKLVLVAHTHWDREWYYTYEKFRYRLVRCVDEVLSILRNDPGFHSFMLDGQIAPLDDYLELRPENAELVKDLVRRGRLLVGPWYVQPDEILVDEESLVRNLLYGRLKGLEYGGLTYIGYLPDTFGHIAQLPQILQGFGIDNFVFHRGMGIEFEEAGTPFVWVGPDGSEVIALFLRDGYCNMAWLPPDPVALADIAREACLRWEKSLRIRSIPGMVGCDHHLPKSYLPMLVREMQSKYLPVEVNMGSLYDILEEARRVKGELAKFRGELLSSHYHWVLYGVWSSRTYLKKANFESEKLLVYYVEPLWTMAWLLTGIYPEREIWTAWRYVLLSHPHDSICGCSVDEVHREVMTRLEKARDLSKELLECTGRSHGALEWFISGRAGYRYDQHAMPLISSRVNLTFAGFETPYVIAFNTLPWSRKAVVKLRLKPYVVASFMLDELSRTAPRSVSESAAKLAEKGVALRFDFRGSSLRDSRGNVIPLQVREMEGGLTEVVWVDELPPLGFKTYSLQSSAVESLGERLRWGDCFIENESLRVEFDLRNGGALRLLDKRTGEVYEGLGILEDSGDVGDEYDYSPPESDRVLTSKGCSASFEVVESGPVYVRAKLSYTLRLPSSASRDRKSRSLEEVEVPIVVFATLYCGISRVDLEVIVENKARDHRLRIVFPTGVRVEKHNSKVQYMVIERPNRATHYYSRAGDKVPVETWPTRLWVDVSDGRRGLCVVAKGLNEYQVKSGETGSEIVYTLLRAVGWLSKGDLLTRPGNAGPEIPTPEAQCLGSSSFEFTIIPHGFTWSEAGVHKLALEWAVPSIAHEDLPHYGELGPEYSLLEVEGDPLLFSTFKKSIDGRGVVLRVYNPSSIQVKALLKFHRRPVKAWKARLDETVLEEIPINQSVASVVLEPYKVMTVKLEFA